MTVSVVSVVSGTYKVLLELLINLLTNVENWSQDKFSYNEVIIENRSSVVVIVLACRAGDPGSITTQCYDSPCK